MILQLMLDRIKDREVDDGYVYEARVWTANRCYSESVTGTRAALDLYYGAIELVFGKYRPDDPTYIIVGGVAVRFRDIEAIEIREAVPGDW